MSEESGKPFKQKSPWHLWVVAVLVLLWNGSGAYTILMARAGRIPDIKPQEVEYYATQPFWAQLLTDIALFAPILGAAALLFRHRAAVWLFAVSMIAVLANNAYDFAAGTSLALSGTGAMVVTVLIAVIAVLEFVYAGAMSKRGVIT